MTLRGGVIALALALSIASSPSRSFAQSAEDRATARQLVADGDRKLASKDFDGAYDAFAKAFVLVAAPTIKVAMGRAKLAKGQLIEAQEQFYEASRIAPQPNEPSSWVAARDAAQKEAATITPRLGVVDLAFEGWPAGRTPRVMIDNTEAVPPGAVEARVPRAVNPGVHGVHASSEGCDDATATVTVGEGERKPVVLTTTCRAVAVAPGGVPQAAPATTTESTPVGPVAEQPAAAKGRPWNGLVVTGAIVAGVGVGAGATFGLISKAIVNDIKNKSCAGNACDPSRRGDADKAKALGTVSTLSFVVGGAGLALMTVGLVSGTSSQQKAQQVGVVIGPTSVGVVGRF